MANQDIDTKIRERVDSFVSELTQLIRQSALQAVEEAIGASFGGSASPRRRAASSAPARAAAPARKKKAARKKRGGRRLRRSPEDLQAMGQTVVDFVGSNPGLRLEELSVQMGIDGGELRQPILQMLSEGRLRTEGRARGTRYFAGSGGGGRKKAGKRRKKSARRKSA